MAKIKNRRDIGIIARYLLSRIARDHDEEQRKELKDFYSTNQLFKKPGFVGKDTYPSLDGFTKEKLDYYLLSQIEMAIHSTAIRKELIEAWGDVDNETGKLSKTSKLSKIGYNNKLVENFYIQFIKRRSEE